MSGRLYVSLFFFFNDTATTEIYTLSLHDALPICSFSPRRVITVNADATPPAPNKLSENRSEEHTSELQSQSNLVCRLLLEKKKKMKQPAIPNLLLRHRHTRCHHLRIPT